MIHPDPSLVDQFERWEYDLTYQFNQWLKDIYEQYAGDDKKHLDDIADAQQFHYHLVSQMLITRDREYRESIQERTARWVLFQEYGDRLWQILTAGSSQ